MLSIGYRASLFVAINGSVFIYVLQVLIFCWSHGVSLVVALPTSIYSLPMKGLEKMFHPLQPLPQNYHFYDI